MGRDASTSRFALPASALRCECVDDDSVLFGYHCQTCCALASTQPSPKTTQQRPSYETAQFACCRVEGAGSCRVALLSTINLPELNCRSGLSLPASPIAGICFPRAGAPVHVVDMRVEDALRTALDGGGLVGQVRPSYFLFRALAPRPGPCLMHGSVRPTFVMDLHQRAFTFAVGCARGPTSGLATCGHLRRPRSSRSHASCRLCTSGLSSSTQRLSRAACDSLR